MGVIMKRIIFCLTGLILMITVGPALGQSAPNLIGSWSGTQAIHGELYGFLERSETIVITEQQGQVFTGYREYTTSGVAYRETFSGVINSAGTKIYLAESEGGLNFGDIVSDMEITMYVIQSGNNSFAGVVSLSKETATE